MARHHHNLLGEGTDVGALGAVAVAVFYFIRDLLLGRPLQTPSVLGQVLLFGNPAPDLANIDLGAVLLYTVVHFVVFAVFGIAVTEMVHLAMRESIFLFALMMIFVVFEVFFYGVTAFFSVRTSQLFPLWTILVANLLATGVMGWYLWTRHPALRRELQHHPLGT
jgi:hypothetical protein